MIDYSLIITIFLALSSSVGLGSIIMSVLTRKKLAAETLEKKANAEKAVAEAEKAKNEALSTFQQAGERIVKQYLADNERLRGECIYLRESTALLEKEVRDLNYRVDENSTCQGELKGKVAMLERENSELKARVLELESENRRLKKEAI